MRTWRHVTGLPARTSTDYFVDDEGLSHEDNINAAAGTGLVAGTARGVYESKRTVTRAQMASHVARVLSGLVRRGDATLPASD